MPINDVVVCRIRLDQSLVHAERLERLLVRFVSVRHFDRDANELVRRILRLAYGLLVRLYGSRIAMSNAQEVAQFFIQHFAFQGFGFGPAQVFRFPRFSVRRQNIHLSEIGPFKVRFVIGRQALNLLVQRHGERPVQRIAYKRRLPTQCGFAVVGRFQERGAVQQSLEELIDVWRERKIRFEDIAHGGRRALRQQRANPTRGASAHAGAAK